MRPCRSGVVVKEEETEEEEAGSAGATPLYVAAAAADWWRGSLSVPGNAIEATVLRGDGCQRGGSSAAPPTGHRRVNSTGSDTGWE